MRKTMHQLRQTKREGNLTELRDSVSDGSLLIRQMTEDERAEHATARKRFSDRPSRSRTAATADRSA